MADYIGICMHYDCTNRNSFGYCKTTACINQNYQHEQWISTSNRTDKVVVKPQTNADRIRGMSDEEMMEYMYHNCHCPPELDELPSCPYRKKNRVQTKDCRTCWLDWLKQEVEDG